MKRCWDCGESKPLAEFYKDVSRYDGVTSRCKPCHRRATNASRKRHPTRTRDSNIRRRLGIGAEEYDALCEKFWHRQKGICLICGGILSPKTWNLDHDHATGYFRGLLCGPCNRGIGLFGEDCGRLVRAATYLRVAQEEQAQRGAAPAQESMRMGGI